MRGFCLCTYYCDNEGEYEDNEINGFLGESKIPHRLAKDEEGGACSCKKQLTSDNHVNLADESPP